MAVVISGTASPDFRSVSTARGRSSSTRSGSTCPPGRTVRSTARNPDSAMTGPTSANGSHCRCLEKTAITGSASRRGDAEAPAARDAVPSAPIVRPAAAARATNSRRLSASLSIGSVRRSGCDSWCHYGFFWPGAAGVSLCATATQRPPRLRQTLMEFTGEGIGRPSHTAFPLDEYVRTTRSVPTSVVIG